MRDQDRRPVRQAKLVPGTVNRDDEHIELKYGDANTLDSKEFVSVALVARGPGEDFTVQYTLVSNDADTETKRMLEEVQKELVDYLIEKEEPDPWKYARYHCSTGANVYWKVHWSHYPKGYWRKDTCSSRTRRADKTRSREARPRGNT